MKESLWMTILFIIFYLVTPATTAAQPADEPLIQAVLFVSPTCGFCHYVVTEVLTPMVDEYGPQLQILLIDVSQPGGQRLYQETVQTFHISEERQGMPALVAVFSVTYLSTSSRQLTATLQSNAGAVKLLTTVLFGALGAWLGYMALVA
jgi:hypothetical protein